MILETVSVKEAADMLGVNKDTLYSAAHSDSERLRGVRCGKQLRLLKEDVDNYRARPYGEKRREEEADATRI